ncbi:AIPR family protein [Lishizhenia sp.]|uniref:AIPR family protein n=1 Tax=Lishizhenia sp. TaxID=2497594 RepID=UPI00299EDC73|nr:AIPR family protein [Lishizhenia sp.]MDX1444914.1 AIPR family protein [Lishizhenia sp.]
MANINDFKLLNIKCRSYFDILEHVLDKNIEPPTDIHKDRIGFYLLMLESVLNIKDISEIVNLITDKEFNQFVFNKGEEDYGVDAIHIDEEENYINFFNFKFREKYNPNKEQNLNETFLSTKLTNAIVAGDLSLLSGKTKKIAKRVIEKLNGREIWKLRLYVISNESKELNVDSMEINQLKNLYDFETIAIGLDSITESMSIRPESINSTLHIDKDSILPFSESSLSSSKSYVIRITASDLIRITCNDKSLRDDYKMEDFSPLANTKMDFNLLFDNVRGLIVKSKFNNGILETLKDEPTKFFLFNNGLTITATDIKSEDTNANKKVKITIEDFQIVNGGQSLRTIHHFNQMDEENITKYLSQCQLLLRVFKTANDSKVRNKIAQFTNSQNAISNIDLKSLNEEQLQIEQFLDTADIIYARKTGDTGINPSKNYKYKISMEKLGQIMFSIQGFPEKASNQKKQIFDKYYFQIFKSENFDLTKTPEFVKKYFEIKSIYESLNIYKVSDQKIFYILYLEYLMNGNIKEKIDLFENLLKNYRSNEEISDARKLINTRFKEELDEKISNLAEVVAN